MIVTGRWHLTAYHDSPDTQGIPPRQSCQSSIRHGFIMCFYSVYTLYGVYNDDAIQLIADKTRLQRARPLSHFSDPLCASPTTTTYVLSIVYVHSVEYTKYGVAILHIN